MLRVATLHTIALVVACLSILTRRSVAEPPVYGPQDAEDYETGKYGWYPHVSYRTTDLVAPWVLHRVWGPECETDDKIVIAPRGIMVDNPGPVMLDGRGHMVWHDMSFRGKMSYGPTVQTYRRKQYLTFWTGYDMDHGHGSGHYYMFDDNYRQYKKISAPHNWMGDLHEFAITRDDTALFTAYVKTKADLRAHGGPKDGWFYDCVFQEMDIETNEVLFEWKSSDHIPLGDTYWPLPVKESSGLWKDPWDYYHINSVQKDSSNNYLISSRYAHAVTYINGKTGKAMWYLGGRNNSFTDLSNGTATSFKWQHNARWSKGDHTELTLFDNQAFTGGDRWKQPPARGLKVKLDRERMTVTTLAELRHPLGYISISQGSLQNLPNGNMLMGFGSAPAVSEFTPEGDLVCDMAFGATFATDNHNFGTSRVMSYRAFKMPWVGRPYYEPKVVFDEKTKEMFVSWNGATEVVKWILDGSDNDEPREDQWINVGDTPKTGFESNITVGSLDYKVFRLTALDKQGRPEGMWRVFSGGVVQPVQVHEKEQNWLKNFAFFTIGAAIAVAVISRRKIPAWWARRWFGGHDQERHRLRWPISLKGILGRNSTYAKDKMESHALVDQGDENDLPDPVMFHNDNASEDSIPLQTQRK